MMGDEQEQPTAVIIRRWRAGPRTLIAIFPKIDEEPGRVLCYEHIGQHGSGDYQRIIGRTMPVWEHHPDVVALRDELTKIGYRLKLYRRYQPRWRKGA
jgi:hypothetical protein